MSSLKTNVEAALRSYSAHFERDDAVPVGVLLRGSGTWYKGDAALVDASGTPVRGLGSSFVEAFAGGKCCLRLTMKDVVSKQVFVALDAIDAIFVVAKPD